MHAIWVAIRTGPTETRLLATAGPHETLLKARLLADPRHPRALSTLLEALALWHGAPVRAVLAAVSSASGSAPRLLHECVADFGQTPLYSLEYAATARPARPRDRLDGLGDFRDLRQLLLAEVAR